ncbi:MAG: YfhO family protein, partial [Bacteroidia bacterium]
LVFLMVLGLVLSNKLNLKIWLISAGLLALFLSMGQNSFLSYIFYDYVPFYNKFRTPTMITAITQICMAILAALGLHALWMKKDEQRTFKKLNLAFYITGGLCLILALLGPSLFDFTNAADEQYGIKDQMLTLFQEYRQSMMQKDAFRSLFIIALAWGALVAIVKNKLTAPVGLAIVALLIIGDQWMVNRRYMDGDTYKRKSKTETLFTPTVADQQILNDKDPDFRVLNMAVSPFNDATNSYYHKSIGGYHGAKLRRYQELIEYGITPEMQNFQEVMKQQNVLLLDSLMRTAMPVMNMLNTRYFIINPDGAPLRNSYTNGNAWFVTEARQVKNADEEILGLRTIDTKQTALVDISRWKEQLGNFSNGTAEGSIRLVSYAPNHLIYETSSPAEQLAVFSEIYYPYGWTATIDGKETEHFRANFVLRCMKIPAGEHKIEFIFKPESFEKGEKISLVGSVLLVVVGVGGTGLGAFRLRKKLKEEE